MLFVVVVCCTVMCVCLCMCVYCLCLCVQIYLQHPKQAAAIQGELFKSESSNNVHSLVYLEHTHLLAAIRRSAWRQVTLKLTILIFYETTID